MIVAALTFVRYELEDENGETRRERNDKFGANSPPLILPENGIYLWNTYWAISESVVRVRDGICSPIAPSEIQAWMRINGEILHHNEVEILRAMDAAYCSEMNIELDAYRDRQNEKQRQEIEAAKSVGKRRG